MSRLLSRENLKLGVVAVFCLLLAWTGPSIAHGVHAQFAHNADKVDGKHAVGAGAGLSNARGKLVAHNGQGQLPAKFIPKVQAAKNADRAGGISPRQLQFPSDIPLGQSVRGRWGFEAPGNNTLIAGTSINLPARAPTTPDVNVVQLGGPPPSTAPGLTSTPRRHPGSCASTSWARARTTQVPPSTPLQPMFTA